MISQIKSKAKSILHGFQNPLGKQIIQQRLTYLSSGAMLNLKKAVEEVEANNIPGIFVETGCALGGSTILLGKTKSTKRKLNVYDVFGMIPPPSEMDGQDIQNRYEEIKSGNSKGLGEDTYYGYEKDLVKKVTENLASFGLPLAENNIHLIQGLYEDSLLINEPVAFAHIDCDWYSSVMTCLNQIVPNLSVGGILVIDDYFDWSGCRQAIDDYFKGEIRKNFSFIPRERKLNIRRLS
jgi:asparagine synthase (glutamine-hydrolysing)